MKSLSQEELRADFLMKVGVAWKPILADLASVGMSCESVSSIKKDSPRYIEAVPILVRHSALEYPHLVRAGIYAALAHRSARALAWDAVLSAYRREPNLSNKAAHGEVGAPSGPKDSMAFALSVMATPKDANTIYELTADPKNGPSRVLFIGRLMRWKSTKPLLPDLQSDPELAIEIQARLKGRGPFN